MIETSKFLIAFFLALPLFMGALPFVVMGKLTPYHALQWVAFSFLAIVGFSLLSSLLTTCSFQEALFLARETFECRPIPMLRAVFVSYVVLIAGLGVVSVAAIVSTKWRAPYLIRKSCRNPRNQLK